MDQSDTPKNEAGSAALSALAGPFLSSASFWQPRDVMESAWLTHGPFAFWLVDALRPRSIVELGTHRGFSFLAFCQAVERLGLSGTCYALDTWQGDDHAGFYGDEIFNPLSQRVNETYPGFATLVRGTFAESRPYFPDGATDLLHIDGRHGYDDVREDFELWRSNVSDRGVILFHDTNVRERDFGVWRLWDELSQQYPSFEFVHGHGLGVLGFGAQLPAALSRLFTASEAEKAAVRDAYSRLGQAVSLQYQLEFQLGQVRAAHGELHALEHRRQIEREELEHRLVHERTKLELTAQHERNLLAQAHSTAQAAAEDAHRSELDAQREQLSAEIQSIQHALNLAREHTHQLESHLGASRAELAQVLQSTTWRASSSLRSLAAQLPPSFRNQLRRVAKGLYWAATPHRMPARRAFLQQRAAQAVAAPTTAVQSAEVSYLDAAREARPRIVFHPDAGGGRCDRSADYNGTYAIETLSGQHYTYVPLAPPSNLNSIIDGMKKPPRFSIVVPTYNTTTDLLSRMVNSVEMQWYPHWQLILADDASPLAETRIALSKLDDPRIEVLLLDQNRGISGATNAALETATGEYIVFLDHDDELTADCLYELALCIEREDADFIYSDEDKIDEKGRFTQPFFKPDWSPDTMMSTMLTCHVSCVRRSLLDEVGFLRSEFDGSQDWDLVLRITEKAQRIAHIPKVLYHWRIIPASVAADLAAKPYAVEAGRRAREAALERRGIRGTMEPVEQVFGYFRVKYAVHGEPLVSIIIPTRDNGNILQNCIKSIRDNSKYKNVEFIILDNGSIEERTKGILSSIHQSDDCRVIRHDHPFNYSELNNLGVRESKGDILLFLNDDTELVSSDGIERMIGFAQQPHVGAVGAKLLYPKTRQVQHSGVLNLASGPDHAFLYADAHEPGYFMRNLLEHNWLAVTGACLMLEKKKYEAVEGFDENFPVAYNDIDLCIKLWKSGLFNAVCPSVEWLHYESLTRGSDHLSEEKLDRLHRERRRLYQVHPDLLERDPFHNPNLHPYGKHFEIGF